MSNQITYNDKVDLNTASDIADINKVTASDMNQIKNAINGVDTSLTNVLEALNNPTYETQTGTAVAFTNSRIGTIKTTIKGNTYQLTTTGKNKMPYTLADIKSANTTGTWSDNVYTWNGVTFTINNDLSITTGGTFSERAYLYLHPSIIPIAKANYIANGCPSGGSTTTYRIVFGSYDGSTASTSISDSGSDVAFNLSSLNNPGIRTYVDIRASSGLNKTFRPMLRLATETNAKYEQYTGGRPAPNGEFPQTIKTVTGNNTIKFFGKNLFDNSITNNEWINYSGEIATLTGCCVQSVNVIPGQTYSISLEWEQGHQSNNGAIICFYDAYGNLLERVPSSTTSTSLSISHIAPQGSAYMYVGHYKAKPTIVQVEKGNVSEYEPYKGNIFTIPFGSIELCKIGNVQDYLYKKNGNWYKHEEITKSKLTGSEAWYGGNAGSVSTDYTYCYTTTYDSVVKYGFYGGFSDYFESFGDSYLLPNSSVSTDTFSIGIPSGTVAVRFFIKTAELPTANLNGFKSWLSTNQPTIYYVKATPTESQIQTASIVTQLENIINSQSFYENNYMCAMGTNGDPIITIDVLQKIT